MRTLLAGTVLFHGTNDPDFDEADDHLQGPAWLTDSKTVAETFARRNLWEGARPRVLSYVLDVDIDLHLIQSERARDALAEEFGLSFSGVEEMRDSVDASGITGWVIPSNYPDGADIMIASTDCLTYRSSEILPAPAPSRRPRP